MPNREIHVKSRKLLVYISQGQEVDIDIDYHPSVQPDEYYAVEPLTLEFQMLDKQKYPTYNQKRWRSLIQRDGPLHQA